MVWPTVSVSVDISAPAQRVWEFVTDITLMAKFSDELQSVEWLDGTAPRLGALFAGTNSHPLIGTWTTQSCVVDLDPPRVFAWAVGDPDAPAATWRFDVSGSGDTTRLVYTACIGPGRSGVSMLIEREPQRREQIVAHRLRIFQQGMAATLAGIKELAESTGQSGGVGDPPRRR